VRGDSGSCIHFAKPPTRWRPVEILYTLRFTLAMNFPRHRIGDRLNHFAFYTRINVAPRLPPVSNYFPRPHARSLAGKLRGMLEESFTQSADGDRGLVASPILYVAIVCNVSVPAWNAILNICMAFSVQEICRDSCTDSNP